MDAQSVMLIKILTDVAMTAMHTVSQIDKMTEEELTEAITEAEALSRELVKKVRIH